MKHSKKVKIANRFGKGRFTSSPWENRSKFIKLKMENKRLKREKKKITKIKTMTKKEIAVFGVVCLIAGWFLGRLTEAIALGNIQF